MHFSGDSMSLLKVCLASETQEPSQLITEHSSLLQFDQTHQKHHVWRLSGFNWTVTIYFFWPVFKHKHPPVTFEYLQAVVQSDQSQLCLPLQPTVLPCAHLSATRHTIHQHHHELPLLLLLSDGVSSLSFSTFTCINLVKLNKPVCTLLPASLSASGSCQKLRQQQTD